MTSPIYNTSRTVSYTLSNNTVNNELDIGLVGDGYLGYGPVINTNLVKLLENFSNTSAPPNAVKGQVWYDSANKLLKVYDNGFFSNVYTLPNSISVANITVDQSLVTANASVARLFTTTGIFWNANGNVYTGEAVAAGYDTQIQFNSGGALEGSYGLTTDGLNLNISGKTTSQTANIGTLYVSDNIKWSNNFPFTSGLVVTPKGPSGSIQFNNGGEFAGASGVSTSGQNLYITGALRASGIRYPTADGVNGQVLITDGSGNLSWTTINVGTISGSGSATQLASFNNGSSIQGTTDITTNGRDLTLADGTVISKNIVLSYGVNGSITFPDGTTQNTAAKFETGGVTGSGTVGQFAYFKTSNGIKSTGGITTNGSDMTINGTLSVAYNPTTDIHVTNKKYVDTAINLSKTYLDNKISLLPSFASISLALAPYASITYVDNQINSIHTTGGTIGGTGSINHFAIWNGTSTLKSSGSITTNGVDITLGAGHLNLITTPTSDLHATNKDYVDSAIAVAIAGVTPGAGVTTGGGVNGAVGIPGRLAYYNSTNSIKSSGIGVDGNNLNVSGNIDTKDLRVGGNYGQLVGLSAADMYVGSGFIRSTYSSAFPPASIVSLGVDDDQYITMTDSGFSKRTIFYNPIEFPDQTIQNTAFPGLAVVTRTSDTIGLNGLNYNNGTLTFYPYQLPAATFNQLGGVKVDNSTIKIDEHNGTISYDLPIAANNQLGGVKVGSGLGCLTDGTLFAVNGFNNMTVFSFVALGQTQTFTIPDGTYTIKVTVVGGGGGGGSGAPYFSGGGGGGGGTAIKIINDLTPTRTLNILVGAGGAAGLGVDVSSGLYGGTSSITSGSQIITQVSGTGGGGGFRQGDGGGGDAGTGVNGDLNIGGSDGHGGGEGTISSYFGNGGSSHMGGGGSKSKDGKNYGGGGGGGGPNSYDGGAGAPGVVIIEY